jgi:hypothetical protein
MYSFDSKLWLFAFTVDSKDQPKANELEMATFKDIFSECKRICWWLKKECTYVLYIKYIFLILDILVILLFILVQMQQGAKMASPHLTI